MKNHLQYQKDLKQIEKVNEKIKAAKTNDKRNKFIRERENLKES